MNSSQAPWWMALATAAIALLGVLLGIYINGRREERRWKREQEREERQWEREREKRREEREHKDMLDWRDRKLVVYSELIEAFKECEYVAAERSHYERVIEDGTVYYRAQEVQSQLAPATAKFRSVMQTVELIGSSELRARVLAPPKANDFVIEIRDSGTYVSSNHMDQFLEKVRYNRENVITTMRDELGSQDETVWSQLFRR